jgi:hypothetical protein
MSHSSKHSKDEDDPVQRTAIRTWDSLVEDVLEDIRSVVDETCTLAEVGKNESRVDEAGERNANGSSVELAEASSAVRIRILLRVKNWSALGKDGFAASDSKQNTSQELVISSADEDWMELMSSMTQA